MPRVCVILPMDSWELLSDEWADRCRAGLEAEGHEVEIRGVLTGGQAAPDARLAGATEWLSSHWEGLSSAMVVGFRHVEEGFDALVVLDATRNYAPEELSRLVKPIIDGSADLAVARRVPGLSGPEEKAAASNVHSSTWRRWVARAIALASRPILGVSDPFSGLVALTPGLAREVIGTFDPVGDRFAVDLILRRRCRRVDVPARVEGLGTPITPSLDDLRHMKRLADDRFGTVSRLVQFCAVGASGMVVDLSSYALLQPIFARTALSRLTMPWIGGTRDLAAAGAIAIGLALTWNFSLNRRLTFNDARGGSIPRQFLTYVLSNALGIALSFFLRLYLPAHVSFFASHKLAAAVVGIVTATGISFTMARWLVFSKPRQAKESSPREPMPSSPVEAAPEARV